MSGSAHLFKVTVVALVVAGFCTGAAANWQESFGGNAFDLPTWTFKIYPSIANTFSPTITDGPANNDFLTLHEPTSLAAGGSAFAMGFGSAQSFADVRLSATINLTGDTEGCYQGLGARSTYFEDPDGSLSGAPGTVASAYAMLIHWQRGPANLRIEVVKIVNLSDNMTQYWEIVVPGVGHARSYYAELDVVGSGPVYITGSLYEYKGGPLVARTPTLIDTNAQDTWEKPGVGNAVFPAGVSGVFAVNQQPVPAGHRTMVDDVSSVSDGPAAVNPTPADGAAGVGSHPILMWTEASFATGRRLWFGPAGAMSEVLPAPAATIYNPGSLAFGTTYQWRVDQSGPGGAVPGHIWTFTTSLCDTVDDFESYAGDTAIEVAWPHNIPPHPTKGPYHYIFLETGQVAEGSKSMRFEYQNQYTPYLTMATRTFATPQNWAATLAKSLVLDFRGRQDNVDQTFFVQVADTTGHQATATHPFIYAVQSEHWGV